MSQYKIQQTSQYDNEIKAIPAITEIVLEIK